jgi:EmrB/QacA subfamily drug resistance transporter
VKVALSARTVISPKVIVSAVYVASMFMNIMDSTVVNVALPTLSRYFAVPVASVSGVVTAYLVTLAMAMPASGWLGDRFGARRVMLGAICLFTAASAMCGLATSLPELVAFRALQGFGGGVLVPVGMAMMYRAFPPAERIRANRLLFVPTLLAPALGPVIGGLLVDGLSWRWIFYVNLPVGAAALTFGALFLPHGSEHPAGRFDLPGFLLGGSGFALFMFALTTGATSGWASARVLATAVLGVLLLGTFVIVELRVAEPMLRLRIYADRLFRTTNLQLAFAGAGFNGTLFLVPLLLQNGLGFTAVHSGLSTFPEALGGMTGIQITSRLYKRLGPRRLMMAGMTGTAATIGGMGFAGAANAAWLIPVLMFFTGCSFGFAMSPSQAAALATVSPALTGQASTLLNTLRQAGAAAGVALLGTVLGATRPGPLDLTGYRLAFFAAACLMIVGVAFSSRVRDADAAATMADGRPGGPGGPGGFAQPVPEAALPSRSRSPSLSRYPARVMTTDGSALTFALARAMLSRFPLIDGHNDLPWEIRDRFGSDPAAAGLTGRVAGIHTDIPRLVEGGVGGQFWSVYVPSKLAGDAAVTAVLEQIDIVHRMVRQYPSRFELALTADEVEEAFAAGKIASLLGAEGGHSIGGSLGVLRSLYELGVRYMTLTHNSSVGWASSATDDVVPGGLTDFGREVVAEMQRLGMLVDLSHVSPSTMHAALDVARAPVIFSHSSALALCDNPRNVPDEVLTRLAGNGGVCMVTFVPFFVSQACNDWFKALRAEAERRGLDPADLHAVFSILPEWERANPLPTATLAQVADHAEHIRAVAGIEHVGIGGDFDGTPNVAAGLEDVSRYPALFTELLRRGWSEADCKAIAGGNVLRVLREAESFAPTAGG